jgi:TonB family protein
MTVVIIMCIAGCASSGGSNAAAPSYAELPACNSNLVAIAPMNWTYAEALLTLNQIGWLSSGVTVVESSNRPEVRNRRETTRALVRSYAAHLRDRGLGGEASMLLYLDAEGNPQKVRLLKNSPYPELDDAAHYVTRVARFHPAVYHDCRVPSVVLMPIVFRSPRAMPPKK